MKDNKDHLLKLFKENKLHNEKLIKYIKDDIPKIDLAPPPIPHLSLAD